MTARLQHGFSLLELMIAISIILIISAIAIPSVLRARQNAYEASAAGFMHTLQTEQMAYRTTHGSYATSFSQLPNLTGTVVSSSSGGFGGLTNPGAGNSSGNSATPGGAPTSTLLRDSYIFTLTPVSNEQWYCDAFPVLDRYYGLYLHTDETGFTRSRKGPAPTANSGYAQ
jgi:prepilin-type N-terminal cleavage/methylation domain-containing protein